MSSLGRSTNLGEERVVFKPDPSRTDGFKAEIESADGSTRPFETDDMGRVIDFDAVDAGGSGGDPMKEGGLMICEYTSGSDALEFTVYHCTLRGGFLFIFDYEDIDDQGAYAIYNNPPIGVVPLKDVEVEYPPGGRRVFREHAHTDARNGYEFAIVHVPPSMRSRGAVADEEDDEERPPVFLVADSMGRRERWSTAIKARSAPAKKPTLLRAGYTKISKAAPTPDSKKTDSRKGGSDDSSKSDGSDDSESKSSNDEGDSDDNEESEEEKAAPTPKEPEKPKKAEKKIPDKKSFGKSDFSRKGSNNVRKRSSGTKSSNLRSRDKDMKSVQQHIIDAGNDESLAQAVVEFGITGFSEQEWMDNFFQVHNDFDAPTKLRQMEEWQTLMKKNLKGAVLEQYEYFVQASGQMTTMGREVASLKTLIETQVETIKEMKEIDFSSAMKTDGKDEIMGRDDSEKPDAINFSSKKGGLFPDDKSAFSDLSGEIMPKATEDDDIEDDPNAPPIDIPEWLLEAPEEITAFVRECRYNDSIDLLLKSKSELTELFDKHERPTAYRLRKAQVIQLREIRHYVEKEAGRISSRLEETLRRKNEALRQAAKRERSDAHAASSTMISPCAISDDTLYLQLLVKMGRNYQAAEAYAARRSLLLLETLHEKPISGSGTVDLVIYAAQLSQSFFSVLASSVEGFLDLFLSGGKIAGDKDNAIDGETMSVGDSSSIHSINNSKSLPSGAIAAVVLWCDGELSKFAAAFGGTRILANLALSPPPSSGGRRSQPRVVGQEDVGKERQNAIQVAAQCLDQAFQHATSNLDAVGLPLTPRLAEYIRVRLKGCEAEVAELLDERFHGFTGEWRAAGQDGMAVGF